MVGTRGKMVKQKSDKPKKTAKHAKPARSISTPSERLAALDARIALIRAREEAKILKAIRESGILDHKWSVPDIHRFLKRAVKDQKVLKISTLGKLEVQRSRLKVMISRATRDEDAARKALLGAFLVAQLRHKPVLLETLVPAITDYLGQHPDNDVAQKNIAALQPLLDDPNTMPEGEKALSRMVRKRIEDHRYILLGAWLLKAKETDAEVAQLVSAELPEFIKQQKPRQQKRAVQLLDGVAVL